MNAELFKKVYIFSGLSDDELENVKNISRLKTYNKGDILFFDTEPYLGFYIVISGMIKIYKISKDGKEHILHIVAPYNTFAEVPLFENFGEMHESDFRYPANCMALEDATQVVLIPARAFTVMLETNNKLCLKLISGFAKRLRYLNHHIEDITLKDVTRRVAGFVLTEFMRSGNGKDKGPDSIKLNISKNDLASLLGTIPETLSRTFKKLSDDGVVDVVGRKIQILDLNKLREISE
jgi:CRP-like cAMP-binding protein